MSRPPSSTFITLPSPMGPETTPGTLQSEPRSKKVCPFGNSVEFLDLMDPDQSGISMVWVGKLSREWQRMRESECHRIQEIQFCPLQPATIPTACLFPNNTSKVYLTFSMKICAQKIIYGETLIYLFRTKCHSRFIFCFFFSLKHYLGLMPSQIMLQWTSLYLCLSYTRSSFGQGLRSDTVVKGCFCHFGVSHSAQPGSLSNELMVGAKWEAI